MPGYYIVLRSDSVSGLIIVLRSDSVSCLIAILRGHSHPSDAILDIVSHITRLVSKESPRMVTDTWIST